MKRFGRIAACSSPAHLSPCRFHDVGKSVLEELRVLASEDIRRAVDAVMTAPVPSPQGLPTVALAEKNVVANYLLHHLVALRLADQAARAPDRRATLLGSGLEYEARAQGFLADGFSSGHMRVPMEGILRSLHTVNTKEAHDFYSSQGLFVVNSRGDVWQAFGDEVTQWYPMTWEHVLEACCISLRELFFVYALGTDSLNVPAPLVKALGNVGTEVRSWLALEPGEFYYLQAKLPTLMLIPFPVTATWSVRTDEMDQHGLRVRKHYPQIRDGRTGAGFSDSTLTGPSSDLLYSWDALPSWMLPDTWLPRQHAGEQKIKDASTDRKRTLASYLVKGDTDVASVRFVQEIDYPPSYAGLVTGVGGGALGVHGYSGGMISGSVGYSPHLGILPEPLGKFHFSGSASLEASLDHSDRMLVSGRVGMTLPLSLLGIRPESPAGKIHGVRLEVGHSEGLRTLRHYRGPVLSAGLETTTIPMGFMYDGIVIRPKVEVHYLQERIFTIVVELLII